MSPIIIKGIQLLLSLSLLVVLHELGHFIPAKLFKTRVEKFYLFFDVKFALFKKKIGGTEYGIGWLPLGGYVKISGMIDESMDTEQMKLPPEPWEFRSKPAWQRLIIMLGGVIVNLLLGLLIYAMIFYVWGKDTLTYDAVPNGMEVSKLAKSIGFEDGDRIIEVDGVVLDDVLDINRNLFLRSVEEVSIQRANGLKEVISVPEDFGSQMFESGDLRPFFVLIPPAIIIQPDTPAEVAGLMNGDVVLKTNGIPINGYSFLVTHLKEQKYDTLQIELRRGADQIITKKIFPREDGTIGIRFDDKSVQYTHVDLTFSESIYDGFNYGFWTLHDYAAQFKYVFTKKGASQVGGFAAIGNLFPAEWNWRGFWSSTALISIILAFMNILPIPALDGGHVMFLMYEIISGRKPNDRFMEYAQMFGFLLLLAVLLFANGNDIYRAIFG
ncbi:MAG: RIP metalloprotease RseP [Flavobacteriales bacterium]|tara:strand:+ start:1869 stop:3188 length:1320 start_codon:yes stop_codon:yes gene_type:complete